MAATLRFLTRAASGLTHGAAETPRRLQALGAKTPKTPAGSPVAGGARFAMMPAMSPKYATAPVVPAPRLLGSAKARLERAQELRPQELCLPEEIEDEKSPSSQALTTVASPDEARRAFLSRQRRIKERNAPFTI